MTEKEKKETKPKKKPTKAKKVVKKPTSAKTVTKTKTTKTKTTKPKAKKTTKIQKTIKNLVIVESPAKIKTISKFLGKDYTIAASFGHVRDLPSKKLGVDIKNNFEPTYTPMKDKKKVLDELKKQCDRSETVYIATDPDREGEAIAWHIIEALKLPDEKVKRIVFNEITQKALLHAIEDSRKIDNHMVDAQQARRILDRLIGYKLSPILSKKIRRGLSAGRVQSVAVKIVCDREKEIEAFIPQEYWAIDVDLSKEKDKKTFKAKLHSKDAPKNKIEVKNKEAADIIVASLKEANYAVHDIKKSKVNRFPYPPFITSTLQQDASRKLNWSAKKTMMMAQQLYEGIEIDGEHTGLITYMRTDSVRISTEAQQAAKDLIKEKFGPDFAPDTPPTYKMKKNSQDAHEAIRPAYADKTPTDLKDILSADHLKLYKLIWDRFISSQMKPALYDRTSVTIAAKAKETYFLTTSGNVVLFEGFTKLYLEGKDDDQTDEKESTLPALSKEETLTKHNLSSEQKFTQPPYRYTEATLVKELEAQGIGRPSTYSPTLSTIQDRGYIDKEQKKLSPTELGTLVNEKLEGFFASIIDLKFTADMETQLDEIVEGKHVWQGIIKKFFDPFSDMLTHAYDKMEKVNTDKPTDKKCEKCDSPMVIKIGRFGDFLACSNFPECKNTQSIIKSTGVDCPDCKSPIHERKSKRGKVFFGCSSFPKCKFASWDEPIAESCPECKRPIMFLKKRKGETEGKKHCDQCKA